MFRWFGFFCSRLCSTNSGCSETNPVKRDWDGIENSPCVSSRRGCLYRIPKNSVIYSRIFVVI